MDIVDKLKSQIGDDPQHIFDHEALFKLSVAEIERLRTEVEELRNELYERGVEAAEHQYLEEMRQLESQAMEEHFRRHPHG